MIQIGFFWTEDADIDSNRGFLVIVLIAMSWASTLEVIASEVNWNFFEEVDRSKVDRDSLTRKLKCPSIVFAIALFDTAELF